MLKDELKRLFYGIDPDKIIFWSMFMLIVFLAIGFVIMMGKYSDLYSLYESVKVGCVYIK